MAALGGGDSTAPQPLSRRLGIGRRCLDRRSRVRGAAVAATSATGASAGFGLRSMR